MPRRAVYVTGWVAVTTAATVIGLGAVGVVRGAVQGNDTVTALSQQQVTEQLQSAAPAGAASTTAAGAATTSTARGGSQQRTTKAPSQPHTAAPSKPATTATPSAPSHPTSTTTSPEAKSSPSPTRTEQSTPTSTPTSSYQAFTSAGGTVFARCTSGNQVSGTATPNNGYRIGEQELGPDSSIKVEFVSDNTKIVVQVTCSGGTATSRIQTESGD